jgi:hypothetical protein
MDLYVQKNGNRMYKSTKNEQLGTRARIEAPLSLFSNTQVSSTSTCVLKKISFNSVVQGFRFGKLIFHH